MESNKLTIINITIEELEKVLVTALEKVINDDAKIRSGNVKGENTWLSRPQAAKYLNVSLPKLLALEKQGKIQAHRTGRKKMYERQQLDEALRSMAINYRNK